MDHHGGKGGKSVQIRIGSLPVAFIAAAFVNFGAGASLGGWMAVEPSVWNAVGALHGEINPFGWLTMLVYGMTYAVLTISAGIRPPRAFVGWLHFALAEAAVVTVTSGLLASSDPLTTAGFALQFAAPLAFLVNILWAVVHSRKVRGSGGAVVDRSDSSQPLDVLRRGGVYQSADRIAQRGTDVALMLFLVGTGWMLAAAWWRGGAQAASSTVADWLVYYGWIGGTVLAVSAHLMPRFFGRPVSTAWVSFGQGVWGLAVVAGAVGYAGPTGVEHVAPRLLGAAFLLFAAVHLRIILPGGARATAGGARTSPSLDPAMAARISFVAGWLFCAALGVWLILGLNPLSLVALHLLLLGFATNLVYGVGHTLFPHLFHRRLPALLATAQSVAAAIGVLLMAIAFSNLTRHGGAALAVLAVGGTLATLAALTFMVSWPCGKRDPARR